MAAMIETKEPPKLRRSIVWPWLLVSSLVHAVVVIGGFTAMGAGSAGLFAGRGLEDGTGFGGDSVALEIAGPEEGAPQGAMPMAEDLRQGSPPMAPEVPVEEVPEETEVLDAEEEAAPAPPQPQRAESEERPPAVPAPEEQEAVPGSDEETSLATDTTEQAAPGDSEEASGTGAEDSTSGAPAGDASGLILGSAGLGGDLAGARRALLPNGGMCDDPAAGVWRAQRYDAGRRQWVQFTLRIRNDGGDLRGSITNRSFTGRPGSPLPGPCTAFGFDMTWRMVARGRVSEDGSMSFEASNVRMLRADCPDSGHIYYPDRFRGTVQPMRDVFHAVNNDGRAEFDQPYTFRRVACE